MTILDLFSLGGRRALVTGGGGGLGRPMAEALNEAGARVAVLGRSESVDAVAAALKGGVAVRADLAKRDDLRRGFDAAVAALGGLDILVTSHGTVHVEDAVKHDLR